MEGNDGLYGSHDFETKAVPAYQKYGHGGTPCIRDIYPMMEFPQSMYQQNITKINYVLNNYQDYLDFKIIFHSFNVSLGVDKVKKLYLVIVLYQILIKKLLLNN